MYGKIPLLDWEEIYVCPQFSDEIFILCWFWMNEFWFGMNVCWFVMMYADLGWMYADLWWMYTDLGCCFRDERFYQNLNLLGKDHLDDFSNFNCSCVNEIMLQLYVCTFGGSAFQTSMHWKGLQKTWKHLRALAESNWNHLLCVQLSICWCIVLSREMFWIVQVAFPCSVWRILNDSFQPNNNQGWIVTLLCCGRRLGGDTVQQPVCFASPSFKFFKLSEPLDFYVR